MAPAVVPQPAVDRSVVRNARPRPAVPIVPVVPRVAASKKRPDAKDVKVEGSTGFSDGKEKENNTTRTGSNTEERQTVISPEESVYSTRSASIVQRQVDPQPSTAVAETSQDGGHNDDLSYHEEPQLSTVPSKPSPSDAGLVTDDAPQASTHHVEVAPVFHTHRNSLTFLAQSDSGIATPNSEANATQQGFRLPHPSPIYRPPNWTTPPPESCEQHGPPPYSWIHHQPRYTGAVPAVSNSQALHFPNGFETSARGEMPSFIAAENLQDDTPPATSSDIPSDNFSEPNMETPSRTSPASRQRSEAITRSQSGSGGVSEAAVGIANTTASVKPIGQSVDLHRGRGDPLWLHTKVSYAREAIEAHPEPLSTYIPRLFDSGHLADWFINVRPASSPELLITVYVHELIVGRCFALADMMHAIRGGQDSDRVIEIAWPADLISPKAFGAALKFLYTGQVVTKAGVEQVSFQHFSDDYRSQRQFQLDWALSYVVSGRILGLTAISEAGVEILSEMIDLDTLELALQVVLLLRKHRDYDTNSGRSPQGSKSSAGSPRRDGHANSEQKYNTVTYSLNAVVDGVASRLKELTFNYILRNLTIEFQVDVKAQTTFMESRLPFTEELQIQYSSVHLASRPALASMQFGEIAPAIDTKPSLEDITFSAILFALPFEDLEELLEAAKRLETRYIGLAKKVVEERENRRRCVLLSKSVGLEERLANKDTWEVVGWEERVDVPRLGAGGEAAQSPHEGSDNSIIHDWKLSRDWKGFRHPGRSRRK